jgi:hypothetical protein
MLKINASVGNKGRNIESDVRCIQSLINKNIHHLVPLMKLKVDGKCGPITIGLISEFQKRVLKLKKPDGRVDPGKTTFKQLTNEQPIETSPTQSFDHLLLKIQVLQKSAIPQKQNNANRKSTSLTEVDYQKAAITLGVETAAIKAIAEIESRGCGFLSNGKPKILFEGHWFSKFTQGKHDDKNPTISYKKWVKTHYLGNEKEYSRLTAAMALDKTAALKSTSWGKFQIMGFNHKQCGYSSVEAFVNDMHRSEHYHLMAFVKLMKSMKWDSDVKAKNWSGFAKKYNGPDFKKNQYDTKIKQAYEAYSKGQK